MSNRISDFTAVIIAVVRVVMAERVTFLAAGIAYYAFVSLVPLLVLAIALGSVIGGAAVAETLLVIIGSFLTPTAQAALTDALVAGSGRLGATTLSVVIFVWSGSKVFRGLDIAFSQIFGTGDEDTIRDHVINVTTVVVAIGVGIILIVSLGTLNLILPAIIPFQGLISTILMFVGLVAVLFPMFYIFPNLDLSIRQTLPGTVVAAFGWTALATVFAIYTAIAGRYILYGVLGGIILLITLFYLGALVLLIGAVYNAVIMMDEPSEATILGDFDTDM